MTNRYFNKSGNPQTLTRGSSGAIRDEFSAIDAGLAVVQAEMDLKAPLESPYLANARGTTPPTDDGSDRLATTAFVRNLSFSFNLPGQGGKAGSFLYTDGSNASWQTLTDATLPVIRSRSFFSGNF